MIRSEHRHTGLGRLVKYREAAGPDKASTLREVERADPQGILSDWILAQRLRLIATNRPKALQMLEDHQAQIGTGPHYLQRIAEEVRTAVDVAD